MNAAPDQPPPSEPGPAPATADRVAGSNGLPAGPPNRQGWWARFLRLCRYRLVLPMIRSAHPPEHVARGTAIGLFWAFTPTIGAQMYLCFLTWLAARRIGIGDFNVIVAMAWTWTTNAITMLPMYYAFYITGQMMLGRWEDLSGYQGFIDTWKQAFVESEGWMDAMYAYGEALVTDWGLAMAIGSIPWAIAVTPIGYWGALFFVRRRRAARVARMQARARARAKRAAKRASHGGAKLSAPAAE